MLNQTQNLKSGTRACTQKRALIFVLFFSFVILSGVSQAQETRATLESAEASPNWVSLNTSLVNSRPNNENQRDLTQLAVEVVSNRAFAGLQPTAGFSYNYVWPARESSAVDETTHFLADLHVGAGTSFEITPTVGYESSVSVGLPTNSTDRKAGFRASLSWENKISYVYRTLTFSADLTPTVLSYAYETNNAAGEQFNKKMEIVGGGGVSWKFAPRFVWSNSAHLIQFQNYANNYYHLYGVSTSVGYSITKKMRAAFAVSTNDRLQTDRNVFEQNNTSTKVILSWTL